ncbi:hypothetical protein H4R19_000230 [Coemansia spiralis]|nr:hypothetical protein H4R19_000230 [Coemansia spiralis]
MTPAKPQPQPPAPQRAQRGPRATPAGGDATAEASSDEGSQTRAGEIPAGTIAAARPRPAAAPVAAFVMPPPLPPRDSGLSLTRVIEEYGERTDLLRLVLTAKTEEDRARAEHERRLQEELRFETRRIEFEMLLHSNYFKQQDQQYQQQLLQPVHRSDMVLNSPVVPVALHPRLQHPRALPHPYQPHAGHVVAYSVPVAAAHQDPSGTRAYHHPDTPGGLDGHGAQNPFAFFKMPLGAPVYHPSAYGSHRPAPHHHVTSGAPAQAVRAPRPQPQPQPQPAGAARRPVPPAVNGLSVRIIDREARLTDASLSAPVDGPEAKKRKISHEEVIMALRRKVMGNSRQTQHEQPGALGRSSSLGKTVQPTGATLPTEESSGARRSSLAHITSTARAEMPSSPTPSSSSSSSSASSSSSVTPQSTAAQASSKATAPPARSTQTPRVPSISTIVDQPPPPP